MLHRAQSSPLLRRRIDRWKESNGMMDGDRIEQNLRTFPPFFIFIYAGLSVTVFFYFVYPVYKAFAKKIFPKRSPFIPVPGERINRKSYFVALLQTRKQKFHKFRNPICSGPRTGGDCFERENTRKCISLSISLLFFDTISWILFYTFEKKLLKWKVFSFFLPSLQL